MAPPPRLRLPQIDHVQLHRLSLFTANPDAEFACREGVLCLVGANGIGKSTLLSAINFCLTGIVPDPNRTFESMDEYYRFTRQYSASYFRGRVEGTDEDEAEVEVTFRLGPHSYQVRRGLFEPDQLRGLTITDRQSGDAVVEIRDETPRSERHATYTSTLVLDCGVSSFEEFVFLQHFVFTFDERRATLFWNQQVLERVLYRAFGVTPDMAKQADSVRREIEHADSRVRNLQFEATKMRRRINQILKEMEASIGAQDKFDTLTTQHAELSKQFDEETKTLRKAEDGLRDVDLQLAQNAALETSLRDDYASYFEEHLHSRPPLSRHPLLAWRMHASGTRRSSATVFGHAVHRGNGVRAVLACTVLNRMTELGRPVSYRIGR